MNNKFQSFIKDIALDSLMNTPVGEKLLQANIVIQKLQDEFGMTGVKAVTVMTFAILKKIADGKTPSVFSPDDWRDIAGSTVETAFLEIDIPYSVFVFDMYERYIRGNADMLDSVVSSSTVEAITALADELNAKKQLFASGDISEITYIEDCLWVCLEAMIKLLASTAELTKDDTISDFVHAAAAYAFEYSRYLLHSRELEIINSYIENQYILDDELNIKYQAYLADLQKHYEQFNVMLENAFSPDFNDAFLSSIELAKFLGVDNSEILMTDDDIDSFFLD